MPIATARIAAGYHRSIQFSTNIARARSSLANAAVPPGSRRSTRFGNRPTNPASRWATKGRGPVHYGAFSTMRQADGRAAMVMAGLGFGGTLGGFGCSTASENQ